MQGCGNVTTCAASSEDSISYNKTPIIIGELYLKFSLPSMSGLILNNQHEVECLVVNSIIKLKQVRNCAYKNSLCKLTLN